MFCLSHTDTLTEQERCQVRSFGSVVEAQIRAKLADVGIMEAPELSFTDLPPDTYSPVCVFNTVAIVFFSLKLKK